MYEEIQCDIICSIHPYTVHSSSVVHVKHFHYKEDKFIVYKGCLWRLFTQCTHCSEYCDIRSYNKGSLLVVKQHCPVCIKDKHYIARQYASRQYSVYGTHFAYLQSTIWDVWVKHQQDLIQNLVPMPRDLILGGDIGGDYQRHSTM